MSKIQTIVPKGVETWKKPLANCRVECLECGAVATGKMNYGDEPAVKVHPHTHAADADRVRKRICFGR